ncbi:MAG: hypothetical protein OSB27_10540 [Planktomarina sp.]|nr:hypothetical protein [Planktomarina sp.]
MDQTETPPSTVLRFAKLVEKANMGKEPAGTFNLVVSNLVQHFRSSGTDKDTKSKFFADGELVQYDEGFKRLEQSHMRVKLVNELFTSQTARVVIERYEDDPAPNLNGSYCIFGGASGVGDVPTPSAIFVLKSNIYDYIEKAFVMPNPQIKLELEFTKSIQREEMSLTFDKPPNPENGLTTNHFTLDSDIGIGLWYAHCKLIEIKNVQNAG